MSDEALCKWLRERAGIRSDTDARLMIEAADRLSERRGNWQPIESAPKGRKIIAGYWNSAGKWRSIMARYYLAETLEWSDEMGGDVESEYAPEGWYEECEESETILPCPTPTHWQPLPEPPK